MEIKKCAQCGRELPITQFRRRTTAYGFTYRSYCHQCEYANNKFNVLDKEMMYRQLTTDEQTQYDMYVQLFDTYIRMGNKVGSGAYNQKFLSKPRRSVAAQLESAIATLSKISDTIPKQHKNEYHVLESIKEMPDFKPWFDQTFEEWESKCIVPSYLRSVLKSLKAIYKNEDNYTETYLPAVKALSDKFWDYESYLADKYNNEVPEWLSNEELIV